MRWCQASRVPQALSLLGLILASLSANVASQAPLADPPRKSNGLTDVVQWDNYTLFIDGQRIFLQYVPLRFARPRR